MSELHTTIEATIRTLVASWAVDYSGPEVRASNYDTSWNGQATDYNEDCPRNRKISYFLNHSKKTLGEQIIDVDCSKAWAWYKLDAIDGDRHPDLQGRTMNVLFM